MGLTIEVEADGKRKLNEAENLRSDASRRSALHQKLVDNLPSIIRESVKPMEQIESIKIVQVDGLPGFSGGGPGGGAVGGGAEGGPEDGVTARGGNLAESVVNSALRYRAQAPFVDTLLSEIGISPHSINVKGLEGLSTADYTPPGEDAKKEAESGEPVAALYRVRSDGDVQPMVTGVRASNGLAWNASGDRF